MPVGTEQVLIGCSVLTVAGILGDVVGRQQGKRRVEGVVLGSVVDDVILTENGGAIGARGTTVEPMR